MSSEDAAPGTGPAISADRLGKCYHIYDRPQDRLFQMIWHGRRRLYREFWALRDVSLRIDRRESVGIIGANGAGKTTLLQLLCGTLHPSEGSIVTSGRVAALLELGTGFNPEFSGRENVFLNAALHGLSAAQVAQRFDAIAAFAEIGEFMEQPVKTYSSGMFVRLAFAVIAHVDAEVLVIDEALAVGDAFFTQRCMRFLRRFREHGTLIFVSHDTGAVLGLCDRAVWLEAGRVRMAGAAQDVVDAYHGDVAMRSAATDATSPAGGISPAVGRDDSAAPRVDTAGRRVTSLEFDPNANAFGAGGARIVSVRATGPDDKPLRAIHGGEHVRFRLVIEARQDIDSAIVGCYVRDRLGQILFGDTTESWRDGARLRLNAGMGTEVVFEFLMPHFPRGTYSLTVAVAEGTLQDHVHHHYLPEALAFECTTEAIRYGLVGIVPERVWWHEAQPATTAS